MPEKIVDLSARSEIIEAEPFNLHFWECSIPEFKTYLGEPRAFLLKMGISVPHDCRIETTIEDHQMLGQEAPCFESNSDFVICNIGSGTMARKVYRVVSFMEEVTSIGGFKKALLHKRSQQSQHSGERKKK